MTSKAILRSDRTASAMSGSASGDSLPTADYYVIGDLVHAEAQTDVVHQQAAETQTAEEVSRRLFCSPAGLAAVCLAGTGLGLACYYFSDRKSSVSMKTASLHEDTSRNSPAEAKVPDQVSDTYQEVLPEIQEPNHDADTCDLAAWPQQLRANLLDRALYRFGFPKADRPDVFEAVGGWTGTMCLAAAAMLVGYQRRAMTVMRQHEAGLKALEASGRQQHWRLQQQLCNTHKQITRLPRHHAVRCQAYQDTRLARQNMLQKHASDSKEAKKAVENLDQSEKQRRMVADEVQRQLDLHGEAGHRLSEEVKAKHEATMQQLSAIDTALRAVTESEDRRMKEIQQKHVSEIQELKDSMQDQLEKQKQTAADEIQRQQDRHDEASRLAEERQVKYEAASRQLEKTHAALKDASEAEQQAASRAFMYEQAASELQAEGKRKQAELSDARSKLEKALAEERKAKDVARGDKAALQLAQERRQQAEEFAKSKQSEAEKAKAERDDAVKKFEEADKERGIRQEHILKLELDLAKSQTTSREEIEMWRTTLDEERDAAQRRDEAAAERLFAAEDQVKQKEKDAWLSHG